MDDLADLFRVIDLERKKLDELQKRLDEMTKDRDRWKDMAHGGPTKRPAWEPH